MGRPMARKERIADAPSRTARWDVRSVKEDQLAFLDVLFRNQANTLAAGGMQC